MSVVVPTVGRWDELEATLNHLRALAPVGRLNDIVVVSDGAGPIPAAVGDVTRLSIPAGGPWKARNRGAEAASSGHLVFLDDDVTIRPAWWRAVCNAIDSGVTSSTGPVRGNGTSLLSRARDQRYQARYADLACRASVNFMAGGNAMVRRDVFDAAGGFPEGGPGSDNTMASRLTGGTSFCWGMAVDHVNDRGWVTALRSAHASGVSDAGFGRDVGKRVRGSRADPLATCVNAILFAARAVGHTAASRRQGKGPK